MEEMEERATVQSLQDRHAIDIVCAEYTEQTNITRVKLQCGKSE